MTNTLRSIYTYLQSHGAHPRITIYTQGEATTTGATFS